MSNTVPLCLNLSEKLNKYSELINIQKNYLNRLFIIFSQHCGINVLSDIMSGGVLIIITIQ